MGGCIMVLNITEENYEEIVNGNEIVLIDFYADWCGPCKMMSPVIDEIANEYEGKVVVGKVNVDKETKLASNFEIMSIPTIIIFKNKKIVKEFIGLQSKEAIVNILNN